MIEELQMAELLCARLCHDLTGPIGAVNNGAEFLSEGGDLHSQAMELITSSAAAAVIRLQFYRMAYGKVRDHGEASLSEKQKMAMDFFAGSKITIDWPDSHADASGVSISIKMSRLLLNLLIVASATLIRGGTMAVRVAQTPEAKQLSVQAQGQGIKFDAEMDQILSQGIAIAELTPKNVQLHFTHRLVEDLGARLTCHMEGERLALEVMQAV